MKARGRPKLPPGGLLGAWVLVEVMRDRKAQPRLSIRAASKRLQKSLAMDFKGGRVLPWETIRDFHKRFQNAMRRDKGERAKAVYFLERARVRRELFGWQSSPWLFLIDPALLESKGYDVEIGDERIVATKRN